MASAVIGALRVNLGIDTAAFSEGLRDAQSTLKKFGTRMQEIGTKFSTRLTAPIAAAGALVTAAVTTMAKDIEQLQRSAQLSNAGFEEFQKLAFAAKSVGIEGDKLSDIFKDVNDRVGDFMATGGGPMADFFENIAPKVGLTADAFKELSGPQALQLYYDSLVKAGASQQEMTFYLEAMASDATALIPLLRDGGRAFQELGEGAAVLSEQDAAGLKAYNDAIRSFGEAVKSLTIAIANSGLLEWITQIINKAAEWTKALAQTNPEIVKWGAVIAGLTAAIGPVLVGIGLMATGLAAISAPVALVVAGLAALTAGVIAFWPEIDAAGKAVNEFLLSIGEGLRAAIDAAVQKFWEFDQKLREMSDNLIAIFMEIPGRMMEIGRNIISGLWQGILGQWEIFKADVSGLASGITSTFKSVLGIHSPSTVMAEIGRNIMQGLSQGMEEMKGSVSGTVGSIVGGIENAFSSLGSSIADAIRGTKEWKDVALDAIRSIANAILSSMSFGGGFFGTLFKGLLGGLIGFANGGSFTVGGTGGIDSQLVAFRATPGEMVDIRKPEQDRGGSLHITFGLASDGALNIMPEVRSVSREESMAATESLAKRIPAMVDRRDNVRNTRKTRA